MKQSLLSIAGLVCCAAFAQSIGKENYKKSLNGPVSSIRVITYKALDKGGGNYGKGEIEKGMENFLISYDKKGNMAEKIAYYPTGSVWWTASYVYEGSDVKKVAPVKKEIKKAAPLEKGEEGFKGKVVYHYDKKAKKPKRLPMMISKCSSGAMGNQLERDSFDAQGTLICRKSCRYDTANHMVEKTIIVKNQTVYQVKWSMMIREKLLKRKSSLPNISHLKKSIAS